MIQFACSMPCQKTTSSQTLVLMSGMPGAGKSTLALERKLGWPVLDKDTVKVALLEEAMPESAAGPASYYVPLALCRDFVEQQRLSVISDSPTAYPNVVREAQTITEAAGGTLKVIFCHASVQVRNQRLTARSRRLSQTEIDPATDEDSLRRFTHLPPTTLRLEMDRPLLESVKEAMAYLSHET